MAVNKQQIKASQALLKEVQKYVKKGLRKDEKFRTKLFADLKKYSFSTSTIYGWFAGEINLTDRGREKMEGYFYSEVNDSQLDEFIIDKWKKEILNKSK